MHGARLLIYDKYTLFHFRWHSPVDSDLSIYRRSVFSSGFQYDLLFGPHNCTRVGQDLLLLYIYVGTRLAIYRLPGIQTS